jgi:hypothetical protein
MLHQRSDKNSHLDTVLYEIDMFRHCATTFPARAARRYDSEGAEAEYNLVIEGFLIHLRNLVGFFTTLHSRESDLRLDRPEVWRGKVLEEKDYSDLRDKARAFNDGYSQTFKSGKKLDCYELISKFLQHCTPERYEQAVVGWDIEKMAAEIEPILADFEKRFAPATTKVMKAPAVETLGAMASCSTTALRKSTVLISEE